MSSWPAAGTNTVPLAPADAKIGDHMPSTHATESPTAQSEEPAKVVFPACTTRYTRPLSHGPSTAVGTLVSASQTPRCIGCGADDDETTTPAPLTMMAVGLSICCDPP